MNHKKWMKIVKWGVVAGVLFVLLLVGFLWVINTWYLDTWIKHELDEYVETQSPDRLDLSYEKVRADLWGQSLILEKVKVKKSGEEEAGIDFRSHQIEIKKFNWHDYLWKGTLTLGRLAFERPVLHLQKGETSEDQDLNAFLGGKMSLKGGFLVQDLTITDAEFSIGQYGSNATKLRAEGLNLKAREFGFSAPIDSLGTVLAGKMDSSQAKNPLRLRQLDIDWDSLEYKGTDGRYVFEGGSGSCSTSNNNCRWSDLKLIPQLPRYRFSEFVGYEVDRISMQVGQLSVEGVEMSDLLHGAIIADKMTVSRGSLSVFRDKRKRVKKDRKPLPHMALKNMGQPINLDTLALRKFDIRYTEVRAPVNQPGTITISDLQADLYGVTNNPDALKREHIIRLDANAQLMDAARIRLQGEFPMYKEGTHTIWGRMGRLKMKRLNSVTVPLKLVRIKDGLMQEMRFNMTLGPAESTGEVKVKYRNFAIQLLNKEDIHKEDHRQILSFLANKLKVRSDSDDPVSSGRISFQRVAHKTVFNYWWKSLASGLKDSIGM